MSVDLTTVLKICYLKEGKLAPHYLLGYLWSYIPDDKHEEIYNSLANKVSQ